MRHNLTEEFKLLRKTHKEHSKQILKDLVKNIEKEYKPKTSILFNNCLTCGNVLVFDTLCQSCKKTFCENHLYNFKCHKCNIVSKFNFENKLVDINRVGNDEITSWYENVSYINEKLHTSLTKFEYLVVTMSEINYDDTLCQQWIETKSLKKKISELIIDLNGKINQVPKAIPEKIQKNMRISIKKILKDNTSYFKNVDMNYIKMEFKIYKQLYSDILVIISQIENKNYIETLEKLNKNIEREMRKLCEISNEDYDLIDNAVKIIVDDIKFPDCDAIVNRKIVSYLMERHKVLITIGVNSNLCNQISLHADDIKNKIHDDF